jgi:hypothetical protein
MKGVCKMLKNLPPIDSDDPQAKKLYKCFTDVLNENETNEFEILEPPPNDYLPRSHLNDPDPRKNFFVKLTFLTASMITWLKKSGLDIDNLNGFYPSYWFYLPKNNNPRIGFSINCPRNNAEQDKIFEKLNEIVRTSLCLDSPNIQNGGNYIYSQNNREHIFINRYLTITNVNALDDVKAEIKCALDDILAWEKALLAKMDIPIPKQPDNGKGTKSMDYISEKAELLRKSKNLIFTGAPGTGKTYLAKQVAKEIARQDDHIGFVQFHPSYDYTDFVEGMRPKSEGGEIGFELRNGVFKEFCRKALKKPKEDFVFIIDEINRGEISKIFGELFFSIDPGYRGTDGKVLTQYANIQTEKTHFDKETDPKNEGWFYVPENVYILGTMNDIDRSVESFDFAMRRRFVWDEVASEQSAINMGLLPLTIAKMKALNNAISSPNIPGLNSSYHIGAAYFLEKEGETVVEPNYDVLWKIRLEPLLREYLRGMPDAGENLAALKNAYEQ